MKEHLNQLMKSITALYQNSNKQLWGYLFFWAFVFLLNTGPHWEIYSSSRELFETVGLITGLQFFVAYIVLKVLIPKLLTVNKPLFFCSLFALVFLASEINIIVRYWYLEPTYDSSYEGFLKRYGHMSFRERMISLWTLKYIFFTKIPLYLYPAVILVANNAHQRQQDLLRLSEQKRRAELSALKNQLNPHFIFNTLNNLYALALKKSDQTPFAIEKLSDILDYILYRCNDKFVSLNNEISLIDNYIGLEALRYGERLSVSFEHKIERDVKIAPLILLTLLENACKHSTGEELNEAKIDISLTANNDQICFEIHNSKPLQFKQTNDSQKKIGLMNMRKQLDLVYYNSYSLEIKDEKNSYSVKLVLEPNE